MARKLTPRERLFVREYLVDLNASQACLRAGYRTKNPNVMGAKLMARPHVAAAIAAAVQAREARVEVRADDVLRELMRLGEIHGAGDWRAMFDEHGSLRPVEEWPEDVARRVASLEVEERYAPGPDGDTVKVGFVKKLKFWPKNDALGLLAKHKGLIRDRVSHENPDGTPIAPAAPCVITINPVRPT